MEIKSLKFNSDSETQHDRTQVEPTASAISMHSTPIVTAGTELTLPFR